MLYTQPFINGFFYYQDLLAYCLYYPAYVFLDEFLSAYITITAEMDKPYARFFHYFLIGPVALVLGLVSLPLALIGFVYGTTFERFRRPYMYRTNGSWKLKTNFLKTKYTFCTVNLCLAPESICRLNNLRHNVWRANRLGEELADCKSQMPTALLHKSNDNSATVPADESSNRHFKSNSYNHDILTNFPILDFVLIQEAFDRSCSRTLADKLLKTYPYVVYDVTRNSLSSNLHALNSGLAFASKYPILDVDFKWFKDCWSQCWFTCKGLLMVKVLLGKHSERNVVGYLATTHLQSYENQRRIIPKQLDNIMNWMAEFRQSTDCPEDVVAFEVVGGDFNFDNMSPGDKASASHRIFDSYVDLGRKCLGEDYDWTVGTTLRHVNMLSPEASSADTLKTLLIDGSKRPLYVLSADLACTRYGMLTELPPVDSDGNCIVTQASGRRRIDRVLVKDNSLCKPVAYNTVTQLAGLTDHLPVTLTLEIDVKKLTSKQDPKEN